MLKDTMYPLRLAVYNTLNGHLSFSSVNVPVYDEKQKIGQTQRVFVLLTTQSEQPDPQQPDDTWFSLSSIDLEIYHKSGFEVTKDIIDDISNQIYALLEPTRLTNGLGVQNNFQFQFVRRERAVSRTFDISNTETVLAKVITISALVVQQS